MNEALCDETGVNVLKGFVRKEKKYRSGLDPAEAYSLKERDTAKKPIEHVTKFASMYECPSCGNIDVYGQKNCDNCGQRLDWSD